MATNYLEQLLAEWYEYKGYFVKRNEKVGKSIKGGYEGELDIVAFNPQKNHLIHLEASTDALSWPDRESRFKKKFTEGDKYIKDLFKGFDIPNKIDKKIVLLVGSKKSYKKIGDADIVLIKELLCDIVKELKDISILKKAIPEKHPILRTIQLIGNYHKYIFT